MSRARKLRPGPLTMSRARKLRRVAGCQSRNIKANQVFFLVASRPATASRRHGTSLEPLKDASKRIARGWQGFSPWIFPPSSLCLASARCGFLALSIKAHRTVLDERPSIDSMACEQVVGGNSGQSFHAKVPVRKRGRLYRRTTHQVGVLRSQPSSRTDPRRIYTLLLSLSAFPPLHLVSFVSVYVAPSVSSVFRLLK